MSKIFDIESDGLLDELTRIHVLVVRDTLTGEVNVYRHNAVENTIPEGLALLEYYVETGGIVVPHNGIKFDIPAIQKVYPKFHIPSGNVLDTLILARAIYPDIKKSVDITLIKKMILPKQMMGRHSLEAWGHRLGMHKGEYQGDPAILDPVERKKRKWESWNQDMEDYCVQDTMVTLTLLNALQGNFGNWKSGAAWFAPVEVEAIRLEHEVQRIVARQERFGFLFDQPAAVKLYSKLTQKKLELEGELRKVFPPFYLKCGELVPKADNKRFGYAKEAVFTKVKLVEFNPGSRDHVTIVLKRRYGWKPEEFTGDGKAKVDETILAALTYPEAKLLTEYFTVLKRLGQIATGKEAWLKHVKKTGRIHGSVTTNGAVTGRMTHAYPNLGQVPASRSPYGHECRALFVTPDGRVLVGADADALELRCLAHFMARFDGGAYVKVVLEGKKEEGTDIHSVNARALGMDPKAKVLDGWTGRDLAKTWFYAFIYGAGDEKLGSILTGKKGPTAKRLGKKSRDDFMSNLPALGKLVEAVKAAAARGHLMGLDGRRIPVRSQHSALNTLLQSAGAIVMKKALVILDADLGALGLKNSSQCAVPDYEFVANVHDEWQTETYPALGETIGKAATEAIRKAGEHFNFRCPLAGAYAVGRTWADTH